VGVTGYEVLRNGAVVGTATGTSYTASGLSASTAYTFAVRAYDAAGNRSSSSGTVSVTTSSGTSTGIDATSRIQAEAYSGMSGVAKEATSDVDGGEDVAWIANGDHLRFDNVAFGSTARTQFSARVASGAGGGVSGLVVVRLDSLTAQPVGSFAIGNTGGWQTWKTVPTNITGVTGNHTVYLTFESGQPADFVNVNWLTFG
jgi:chitodextrinase